MYYNFYFLFLDIMLPSEQVWHLIIVKIVAIVTIHSKVASFKYANNIKKNLKWKCNLIISTLIWHWIKENLQIQQCTI